MATKTTTIILDVDDQGAVNSVENLDNNLQDAAKSAKDLGDNLDEAGKEIDRTEGRIKVLGGAINILGGTAELAVGALATIGVPEESVERVQELTLGTIALADGAKRTFEGFKELREGVQAYGGTQKVVTGITKAFGVAFKVATGPVGLIITAIGLLAGAVVLLKDKLEIANKVFNFFANGIKKVTNFLGLGKTEAEKFAEAQGELAEELDFELKLLQAQGASIEELIKKERELLIAKKNATKEGTDERKAAEQDLAIFEAKVLKDKQDAEVAAAEKRKEQREKELQEYRDSVEKELEEFNSFVSEINKRRGEAFRENVKSAQEELGKSVEAATEATNKGLQAQVAGYQATLNTSREKTSKELIQQQSDTLFAYAELAENAVGSSVDAFGQLFGALSEVTGEGNEEAFEKGKKFKIAEVVTSAIQASFQAFGAAQQFGPILGPILGAAQVAAIAVSSNKAIQDIRSSTFDGGGSGATPSVSTGGGGPIPTAGGILSTSNGGAGSTTISTPQITPQEPARAYVLVNDVNSAQEAGRAINRRRSLTG